MSKEFFADKTEKMINLLQEGKVNLLLGAGFSCGAKNINDNNIPCTSRELAIEFKKYFDQKRHPVEAFTSLTNDLENQSQVDLQRIAEEFEKNLSISDVEEFYNNTFISSQKYPAWFNNLLNVPWKKIYTLNYDNLVETIFTTNNTPKKEFIFSPFDAMSTIGENEETPIVHIHGSIPFKKKLDAIIKKNLIITREDHGNNSENLYWNKFIEDYLSNPFIIVGCTLNEPVFDSTFGYYVKLTNNSTPIKENRLGFFVSKGMIESDKKNYKQHHNIDFITATNQEFLEWIGENFQKKTIPIQIKEAPASQIVNLNEKFWQGIKDNHKADNELLNYYIKADKRLLPWVIEQGWYFPPDDATTYEVSNSIEDDSELATIESTMKEALKEKFSLLKISGRGGEGKSSLLYWIAHKFHKSYNILYAEAINEFETAEINQEKNTIIIVDETNMLYESEDTDVFFNCCKKSFQKNVVLIVSERIFKRNQRKGESFSDVFDIEYTLNYNSAKNQAIQLFNKITQSIDARYLLTNDDRKVCEDGGLSILEKALSLLLNLKKGNSLKESGFSFEWDDFDFAVKKDLNLKNLYFLTSSVYRYNIKLQNSFFLEPWISDGLYSTKEFYRVCGKDDSKPLLIDERGLLNTRHQLLAEWYFKFNEEEESRHLAFWRGLHHHLKNSPNLSEADTYILRNISNNEKYRSNTNIMPLNSEEIGQILNKHLKNKQEWDTIELCKCVLDYTTILNRQGDKFEDAERLLNEAIDVKKCKFPQLYSKLANNYYFWGKKLEPENPTEASVKFQKAIATFEKLRQNEPSNSYANSGIRKLRLNMVKTAEDAFSLAEADTSLLYKIARYFHSKKRYSESEKICTKLFEVEKGLTSFPLLLLIAKNYRELGHLFIAVHKLEELENTFGAQEPIDVEKCITLRKICIEKLSSEITPDFVLKKFEYLLEKYPDSFVVRNETAKTINNLFSLDTQKIDEAEKLILKNLDGFSEDEYHIQSMIELAKLYQRKKNCIDLSIKTCDNVLEKHPDSRPIRVIKANSLKIRNKDGDFDEAEKILLICFNEEKDDVGPAKALIDLYATNRNIDSIVKFFDERLAIINDYSIYVFCSKKLVQVGNTTVALDILEKGIRRMSEDKRGSLKNNRLIYQKFHIQLKESFTNAPLINEAFTTLNRLSLIPSEKNNIRLYTNMFEYYSFKQKLQYKCHKARLTQTAITHYKYCGLHLYSVIDNKSPYGIINLIECLTHLYHRPRMAAFWGMKKAESPYLSDENRKIIYKTIMTSAKIYKDKKLYDKCAIYPDVRATDFIQDVKVFNHSQRCQYDDLKKKIKLPAQNSIQTEKEYKNFPFNSEALLLGTHFSKNGVEYCDKFEPFFNPLMEEIEYFIANEYKKIASVIEKHGNIEWPEY
jgi:tetratricopeptide (TPR) repeat protein